MSRSRAGAVTKEEAIQRLMLRLQEELGNDRFVHVPNWDDETDSFGVAQPQDLQRLAYICSYPDGFFVSLELAPEAGSDSPYANAGTFDRLTDAEVLDIVRKHLRIQ